MRVTGLEAADFTVQTPPQLSLKARLTSTLPSDAGPEKSLTSEAELSIGL